MTQQEQRARWRQSTARWRATANGKARVKASHTTAAYREYQRAYYLCIIRPKRRKEQKEREARACK